MVVDHVPLNRETIHLPLHLMSGWSVSTGGIRPTSAAAATCWACRTNGVRDLAMLAHD